MIQLIHVYIYIYIPSNPPLELSVWVVGLEDDNNLRLQVVKVMWKFWHFPQFINLTELREPNRTNPVWWFWIPSIFNPLLVNFSNWLFFGTAEENLRCRWNPHVSWLLSVVVSCISILSGGISIVDQPRTGYFRSACACDLPFDFQPRPLQPGREFRGPRLRGFRQTLSTWPPAWIIHKTSMNPL